MDQQRELVTRNIARSKEANSVANNLLAPHLLQQFSAGQGNQSVYEARLTRFLPPIKDAYSTIFESSLHNLYTFYYQLTKHTLLGANDRGDYVHRSRRTIPTLPASRDASLGPDTSRNQLKLSSITAARKVTVANHRGRTELYRDISNPKNTRRAQTS